MPPNMSHSVEQAGNGDHLQKPLDTIRIPTGRTAVVYLELDVIERSSEVVSRSK